MTRGIILVHTPGCLTSARERYPRQALVDRQATDPKGMHETARCKREKGRLKFEKDFSMSCQLRVVGS